MTTFTWNSLPKSLEEMKDLAEASLKSPEETAALTVAALCAYRLSPEACNQMMEYLKGPAGLSTYEKQFLKDRLSGKDYVPYSYMNGSSPENSYQPSMPFSISIERMPDAEEGYAKVSLRSSGADAPRPIRLRLKGSTGQWFLDEQFLLADIRVPAAQDPWK